MTSGDGNHPDEDFFDMLVKSQVIAYYSLFILFLYVILYKWTRMSVNNK